MTGQTHAPAPQAALPEQGLAEQRAALAGPARLAAVAATGLLDGRRSTPALDRICRLAARALAAPVVAVSLVDPDAQCLLGAVGLPPDIDRDRRTPVSASLCRFVVAHDAPLVVTDARVEPFLRTDGSVHEGGAVAYAGVPLRDADGQVLGSFCAADPSPREWTADELRTLEEFAEVAAAEVHSATRAHSLMLLGQEQATVLDNAREAYVAIDTDGRVVEWNRAASEIFGWTRGAAVGRPVDELMIPEDLREAHRAGLARLAQTDRSTLLGQRLELPAVCRDGSAIHVEMTLGRVDGPAGVRFHAFLHDITERRRAERLVACELAVATALVSAGDLDGAAAVVLEPVALALDARRAALWLVDEQRAFLVRTTEWAAPGEVGPDPWPQRLARGEGVPGRAWEQGHTLVAPHGDGSCTSPVLAVPVRSGRRGLGVLVVVGDGPAEPGPALRATMESVAAHLGQVLERSRAERLSRQLAVARAHLERTVAQIDDYLFTVEVDGDGAAPGGADERPGRVQVRYASPDGSHVFGGPVDLGSGLDVVLAELVHPEDRPLLDDFLVRVVAAEPAEVEVRLVGRDGRTRSVWVRGRPRRDGDRLLFDGICTDVTERRRLTEELRASRALLQAVLDNSDAVVFAKDGDGRYLFVNSSYERLFGVTEGEVLGRTDAAVLPEDAARRLRENDLAVQAAGTLARLEEVVPTAGGPRTFLTSKFPLPAPDGAGSAPGSGGSVGICGVAVDITERKESELLMARLLDGEREQVERLRDLDRMKDEFVALASHELRTPLTSVHGYAELLLDEPGDLAEQQLAFLRTIRRNADRLLRLIGNLLDLTRITDTGLELDARPLSLSRLVREAVEALGAEAERKGLTLTADLPATQLVGDPTRLRQVVDNLLTNAVKYTPDGGRIDVRLGEDGDRVRLRVRDTGIGIPEAELPQLFTRFFRTSRARARQIDGTGLGLAVTRAIVERHGGTIAVQAADPGTVFTVELPSGRAGALDSTSSTAPPPRATL